MFLERTRCSLVTVQVTFRSRVLPLPKEVLDYLLDNQSLVLPK